jgi:hypothetical protein
MLEEKKLKLCLKEGRGSRQVEKEIVCEKSSET